MPLSKETEVQSVTVTPEGNLREYSVVTVLDDGVEVTKYGKERIVQPGDDLAEEVGLMKEIGAKIHTVARKNARADRDAAREEV